MLSNNKQWSATNVGLLGRNECCADVDAVHNRLSGNNKCDSNKCWAVEAATKNGQEQAMGSNKQWGAINVG
jgi:hypothetical protein